MSVWTPKYRLWLMFRFLVDSGAMNDETAQINSAIDYEDGKERVVPETAKLWRSRGQSWMLVGDVGRVPSGRDDTDSAYSTTLAKAVQENTLRYNLGY